MPNNRDRKRKYYGSQVVQRYYRKGNGFTMLFDEYLDTPAYQVLTHAGRLILLDVMRHIRDTYKNIPPEKAAKVGFQYTHRDCREQVSEGTFHTAMQELRRIGWVDVKAEHQHYGLASPIVYSPSTKWRDYKPTQDETAKIQRLASNRVRRMSQSRKHRMKYIRGNQDATSTNHR